MCKLVILFYIRLLASPRTQVMDDTMRMFTELSRKSLRAVEKSGHHNVPGRNQEVPGVLYSARPCVIGQHFPSSTCRIQILTSRQRNSHHPTALVAYGAVTNSMDTTIKLHSAHCYESIRLTMQKAASGMSTQFLGTPPEFRLPYQNQLHNCEFPQVSFRCGSGQTLRLLPYVRQTSSQSHTM